MTSKKIGLPAQIRSALKDFVQIQSQDGKNTQLDVLRAFEKEARLLYETEAIVTNFEVDPFELFRFNNNDGGADDADTQGEAVDDAAVHTHKRQQIQEAIQHLQTTLEVTSCTRIRTGINRGDYCQIDADVEFHSRCSSASSLSSSSSATNQQQIQLSFRYERKRRQGISDEKTTGFHIRYAIELSINHQHKDELLVVEVWSPYNTPSLRTPARCRNDELMDVMDDDDGSDDNNNDNDDESKKGDKSNSNNTNNDDERNNPKRRKLRNNDNMDAIIIMDNDNNTGAATAAAITTTTTTTKTPKSIADKPDEYITYLDPDVLRKFLEVTNLYPNYETAIDECTAYFMLMTFPFYEHEWDLVGYICESIFAGDDASDDDDDDDDDDNDNDNHDEINTMNNGKL